MIEILKRYSIALILLVIVSLLMLLGTLGVMEFGQKMVDDIGDQEMTPRGEVLNK